MIAIDVGGTTIKYGLWDENLQMLSNQGHVTTPTQINDFYQIIQHISKQFNDVDGIGFSIPGAVNQRTGIIGGISAIPYIHNFPIQAEIEKRLKLPIAMENDANCAALAEVALGAARNLQSVSFVVIGTGVGGAIVVDRQIIHGHQLYGGEFGMMLGPNNTQLSTIGTPVHVADAYNEAHRTNLSGKEVFKLAIDGNNDAKKVVQVMYANLAHVIYNIQFSTDPEAIIIGGGISENPSFIQGLNQTLEGLVQTLGDIPVIPQVIPAKTHNNANLVGAAYNFYH